MIPSYQVMVEGGLMSSPTCDSAVSDCNFGDCCSGAERVLSAEGTCYRIGPKGARTKDGGSQR